MILDQSRLLVDDITLNEEHALFLADKARATLLAQKYKNVKLEIPESNYQVLCLDLQESAPIEGKPCEGEWYVRSTVKLPKRMTIGNDTVSSMDFYQGLNICLVARERMRYVGHNSFLKNIIYCSIGPDGYLYFKSNNPQYHYLKQAKFTGIFENTIEASKLACDTSCELMDREFPIEEALATPLIEAVVKELVGAAYHPRDERNNANDDSGKVIAAKQ